MGKILFLALAALLVWRLVAGRWPWQPKVNPVLRAAERLLGVSHTAGREAILQAHRTMIARVHPDRGGSAEDVHRADDARDVLLKALDPRIGR